MSYSDYDFSETFEAAERLYDEGRYFMAADMFRKCLEYTNDAGKRSRVQNMIDMCGNASQRRDY